MISTPVDTLRGAIGQISGGIPRDRLNSVWGAFGDLCTSAGHARVPPGPPRDPGDPSHMSDSPKPR
jgi:hypothetical protein